MKHSDFLELAAGDRDLYFKDTYIRIMPENKFKQRLRNTIISFENYKEEHIFNPEKLKPCWFWWEELLVYGYYFPRRFAKRGYCDQNTCFFAPNLGHFGNNMLALLRAWEKKDQHSTSQYEILSDSLLYDKITNVVYFETNKRNAALFPESFLKGQ